MKALAQGGLLFRRSVRKPIRLAASAAAVTFALSLAASDVALAGNCRTVSGTVNALQAVPCPAGDGSCFQTTFTGDLRGSSLSALTVLLIVDPVKGEAIFSAQSALEIQAPNGVIYTTDVGKATGCQVTNNQLVCASSIETLVITSGERAYKKATGQITLSGPYFSGKPGTYEGQICKGNQD
jgi:hypothetical protein